MDSVLLKKINGKKTSDGAKTRSLKNWLFLFLWIAGLIFFMQILAPLVTDSIAPVRAMAEYIERSGIDAGAIYYSEVEEVSRSEQMIKNSLIFISENDMN
ncbi:MAG: hypothetical protein OEZ34_10865 [Spirochaetia bacterium]|nr:hypothetical protein [Spirochaetia bacterium]